MWLSSWQRALTTWALPVGVILGLTLLTLEAVNLKRKNGGRR